MAGRGPILCIGAAHWDFLGRTSDPLPAGADVPGRLFRQPGGVALNVARALAALDFQVVLLSAIGRDLPGLGLVAEVTAAGIDAVGLHRHDGPTDCYLAIEGRGGELHAAVADCTGLERAGTAILAPLRDGRIATAVRPWDGRVVIDGNLPGPVLAELIDRDLAPGAEIAIVPASPRKMTHIAAMLGTRPATLYLNRREAEELCATRFADSRAAAQAVLAWGVAEAVVTDGAAAATVASAAGILSLLPPAVATRSLTGAGDAFVAAHLAARADRLDPAAALQAALAASARHIALEVP